MIMVAIFDIAIVLSRPDGAFCHAGMPKEASSVWPLISVDR